VRWQQIDRYIHIFDPKHTAELLEEEVVKHQAPESLQIIKNPAKRRKLIAPKPCQKTEQLYNYLGQNFQRFWRLSTNFTINEAITRFHGHSRDTVTIPTKPTPISFKFWVLANKAYMYD
jgi:hypothetical protein